MIYAIKKIWKSITASANDFADQIEDHEKNGRQAIRKLNSEINKTRDIIIETMVSYRTLEAKYDGLNKDLVSQKAKLDSHISKKDDISAKEIFKTSEIREVVDIPLVLHGASGLSDEDVMDCVKRGICKVNFATELRAAYSKAVRETLEDEKVFDPKAYGKAGIAAVKELVMARMKVCGCDGKAE